MTAPSSSTSANSADATLRPARIDDLASISRLLSDSHLPLDGVADALPDFAVAESEGSLVGVAGLERCGRYALLRSVVVSEAWRSRRLGRALVERVIADADSRGVPSLYLLTTTAERYFPMFGFREITRGEVPDDVRETAEFQGACPASAVVMVRPCGGAPPTERNDASQRGEQV